MVSWLAGDSVSISVPQSMPFLINTGNILTSEGQQVLTLSFNSVQTCDPIKL